MLAHVWLRLSQGASSGSNQASNLLRWRMAPMWFLSPKRRLAISRVWVVRSRCRESMKLRTYNRRFGRQDEARGVRWMVRMLWCCFIGEIDSIWWAPKWSRRIQVAVKDNDWNQGGGVDEGSSTGIDWLFERALVTSGDGNHETTIGHRLAQIQPRLERLNSSPREEGDVGASIKRL